MAKGTIKVNKKGVISIHNLVTNGKHLYVTGFKIKKQKLQDNESKVTIKIDAILKIPDIPN